MDKKKQKDQLKHHFIFASALSVLIIVSGIYVLVSIADGDITATFLASILVIVPPLMMLGSVRWVRRSFWIYDNTEPVWMIVSARHVHGAESPPHNYVFTLVPISDSTEFSWVISPFKSGKHFAPLVDTPQKCLVYFDPKKSKPDIIETSYGVVWRGGGRAKTIGE